MARWSLNLAIALASTAVALLVGLALLRLYASTAGGLVPERYLLEPRPRLWKADETVGYVNRPHLDLRAFGNVVGRTNAQGFRAEEDVGPKRDGTLRIIGIGDSVTWGTRVNEEETFLGVLRARLRRERPDVQVINAGVVGYSTWQELFFLEEHVLSHRPDVVLVNFHTNDYLPSENPFDNLGPVLGRMWRRLRGDPSLVLDAADGELLIELTRAPWRTVRAHLESSSPELSRVQRLLVDVPAVLMARVAASRGIRFVYVLVPGWQGQRGLGRDSPAQGAARMSAQLRRALRENGVEFVDLGDALLEDPRERRRGRRFEETRVSGWLERSRLASLLGRLSLAGLDPAPSLRGIGRLRDFERIQREELFIDEVGHPTVRGHRIIGEHLHAHLVGRGVAETPVGP